MAARIVRAAPLVVAMLVLIEGCRSERPDGSVTRNKATSLPTVATQPPPLDRLAPGELQASSVMAFGFPVPTTMRVDRAFPNAVHLVGDVNVQGLVRYVQANTVAASPELRGNLLVFNSIRLPDADPTRTFRIEIASIGRTTTLALKDTTPAKLPEEPGVTDEERWRRAGMKSNGSPLDVSQLQ